jgi:predicted membrane protein
MENEKQNKKPGRSNGIVVGIILLLIGILFLSFNFGCFSPELKWIFFSWQMLLMLIGVVLICKRNFFGGGAMFITGAFFIIPKLMEAYPYFFPGNPENFTHTFWPVLIILGGILILFQGLFGFRNGCCGYNKNKPYHCNSYRRRRGNTGFEINSIFASNEHVVHAAEFKGATLNSVFGELKYDLRKTNLPEGETTLEINCVFGGITIFVPTEWAVSVEVNTVMWGFNDKRTIQASTDTSKKLIISGDCVLASVELKN